MAGKVYITEDGKPNRANPASGNGARGSAAPTGNRQAAPAGNSVNNRLNNDALGYRGAISSAAGAGKSAGTGSKRSATADDKEIEALARKMLKKKEQRRKGISIAVAVVGVLSIGFFIFYSVGDYHKSISYKPYSEIVKRGETATNQASGNAADSGVVIHYDEEKETPDVLPKFKDLLAVNKNIIGWLKMDPVTENAKDGFPVAQTTNNEYYLDHDLKQNSDRNGTIFMDCACDVLKPSTNLILYGHHMRSGNMFGLLEKYQDESYYQDHKYIYFDTLYEEGKYQVMYVFRSHVYSETEVAFKYYQFIDAYSEVEFASYMQEMANMSLYDTGVAASYGDRLLTLSTCDYQEKDGRFVVVAKKID
ncbi:MAG: class B sortase [Lachnospiraceae bacterium]|nr:class B sortase [Lachnospiraceae bacterium]